MRPIEGTRAFFASFKHMPAVMGILNVTPDSFYDGGRHAARDAAVEQAARMVAEGAAIIDVGGESTRPGFQPVSAQEEIDRVAPVIQALAARFPIPISIDTTKAMVAEAAFAAGAHVLNDIWGLQSDPALAAVAARHKAGVIIMHNRAEKDEGLDIFSDMDTFFTRSLSIADEAGINRRHVVLDPGVGFGKTREQNLAVIARLSHLKGHGQPLLMGLSRKSFIGMTISDMQADRLPGTIAANLAATFNGARVLRVHDVGAHVQALKISHALRIAGETDKANP